MKNNHIYKKELKEIWHQVPPNYYQQGVSNNFLQRLWHLRKLRVVVELIKSSGIEPSTILDVGCASGWFLSQLSRHFPKAKYYGIDVYSKAIIYGRKKYKKLKLIEADAHSIPFSSQTFDLVVCAEVLEHVVKPEGVLREIKRVLRKNGLAVVEMDSGNILFQFTWFWWTNLRNGVWRDSHIHSFNSQKLEAMIRKTKFHVQSRKVFNYSMAVAFSLVQSKKVKRIVK